MNTKKKIKNLISFADTLSYEQKIIYSSDGNLKSHECIERRKQDSESVKPYGLWYSFGPSWIDFLTGFEFDPDEYTWEKVRLSWYTHIYQIYLNYKKIIKIETVEEFDSFSKKFSDPSAIEQIDWAKVEKEWSGIEIKFLESKTDVRWYRNWDCSSGCIWKRDAVKKIELLKSWNVQWLEDSA